MQTRMMRRTRCGGAALAALALMFSLPGCGGDDNGGPGVTAPFRLDINWPERSRAVNAPSSALSLRIRLANALPTGGDFTAVVNRAGNLAAHTQTFDSGATRVLVGNHSLVVDFFAQPDAGLPQVGSAAAAVRVNPDGTLTNPDGTPLGTIQFTGVIDSVEVLPGQAVLVGSSADLLFTARNAQNEPVAVTPGSALINVTQGGNVLSVVDGRIRGLAPGQAMVTVTIDGKTSAAVPVNVVEGTQLTAPLTGGQESANVQTSAGGQASVVLDGTTPQNTTSIQVALAPTGLANGNISQAHIHVSPGMGIDGPIVFSLFNRGVEGTFPGQITRTLTAANLQPQPAQGVNTFADAVSAILEGRAYVNVHTDANPAGEIRGQIASALFRTVLAGANERPNPVPSVAGGNATVAVNSAKDGIGVVVHTSLPPANITRAHIHVGTVDEAGPVIFTLYESSVEPALTVGRITKQLTAADLQPKPAQGVNSFADALEAIRTGRAYINVHTEAYPLGEIRGQLSPLP